MAFVHFTEGYCILLIVTFVLLFFYNQPQSFSMHFHSYLDPSVISRSLGHQALTSRSIVRCIRFSSMDPPRRIYTNERRSSSFSLYTLHCTSSKLLFSYVHCVSLCLCFLFVSCISMSAGLCLLPRAASLVSPGV